MFEKIKKQLELVKILDIIIVVTLMVASFIPHIVYGVQSRSIGEEARIIAIVSIDGEEVYSVELSEDTVHEEFTLYPSKDQYNVIEVDGTRIRNKEDNSPDQLGVRKGWISRPGDTAVVLPHRLIIEIKAINSEESPEEEVIIPL
ncbi:NusG domain II-containing protein [Lacticigenium naphthae]|uniref:NusG domain II-containing protein n=1 Tax=Lacticigenium naphthae TaxID=515351 RepID=UPI0004053F3A|nr:NusG domain II-containing protein [Lacticigenium naphthae]